MTTTGPLVSVVIPAYNAARTIRETVSSALEQTMSDVEVIVVDDGSQDDTVDLVAHMDDPRVKLVRQPNAGPAAARNNGIRHATGEWVALLDADDLWLPQKLERQLELLAASPGALAAQGSAYIVDDDLRVLHLKRSVPTDNLLLSFLRFQNLPNAPSSWLAKRSALTEQVMFDPDLVILEDWDFSLKLARYANPITVEEPLSMYRQHPGNRSRNFDIHVEPGFRVLGTLFSDPDLPPEIRERKREIYARYYTMLCGGALRSSRWGACIYWGTRAVTRDPRMLVYITGLPLRRLRRRSAATAASPRA
jgi:glycosyltransferase involved in cell wall biosynthesis